MLVLAPATGTHAGPDASPFNKGSVRFSLLIGSGTAFDRDYTIFGIGGAYYVMDGLELGLDYETWQDNQPHIQTVSPQGRYVFHNAGTVKPYAGTFFRRTFIEDYEDQNQAGLRAGGVIQFDQRATFSAGIVYDIRFKCDKSVYSSCSDVYPELAFAVLF
jgi:hypothetical protein